MYFSDITSLYSTATQSHPSSRTIVSETHLSTMDTSLVPRSSAAHVLHFKMYYYEPSMPAAIIFIVLFAASTSLHLFQMIRTRTWFLIPFVIGGIMETVGYIGRVISASENPGPDYSLGPYILQSLLLLVAPALLAASIYMELGRIVLMANGEQALFIRRTWLTKIFVVGDVFSFLLQMSGAGLLASRDADMIKIGKDIVIVGLFTQVIFFGLFVAAAVVFHIRLLKAPTQRAQETPWLNHMTALYTVSILIFVRSIVRVVEYIQGTLESPHMIFSGRLILRRL